MKRTRRIALLLGQDLGYCRDVMRGVWRYAMNMQHWVFRDGPPEMVTLKPLREWRPHGVIALLFISEVANALARMRVPVVNTTSTLDDKRFPLVEADHSRVGRMAADYFVERRYRHFGYFGSSWTHVSRMREAGFKEGLRKIEHSFSPCYADYLPRPPQDASWLTVDTQVAHWLRRLAKPVAILCSNDVPARDLADACRRLQFRVPEDVAILGVDNDELECRLTTPPLSTIELPAERIGFEAAKLLDRLMSGRRPPKAPLYLPPVRVVTRQSTDALAVANPTVTAALAYIRERYAGPVGVDDVARAIAVGRRDLERKFRRVLGRSVHDQIRHLRIERAKELLVETDHSMPEVAARAGFMDARRFAVVFRHLTGNTPTGYRRRSRARD
jgi:LacI family transcriptional regulator